MSFRFLRQQPIPLTEDACWARLRASHEGLLAASVDVRPQIVRVRFVVEDERILILACEGSPLTAIDTTSFVAFESDGLEVQPDKRKFRARSVVMVGTVDEILDLDGTDSDVPHSVSHTQYVRITPELISGRRSR